MSTTTPDPFSAAALGRWLAESRPNPPLYHFTCSHSDRKIGTRGDLVPHEQPMLGGVRAVWATDLPEVPSDAATLGLTSYTLSCDRTEHRYRILRPELFEWFPDFMKRTGLGAELCGPDQQPEHWWLAFEPVRVHRSWRQKPGEAREHVATEVDRGKC